MRVEISKKVNIHPVRDIRTKQLMGVSIQGVNARARIEHLYLPIEGIPEVIECLNQLPDRPLIGVDIDQVTKVRLVPPEADELPKFIEALQSFTQGGNHAGAH